MQAHQESHEYKMKGPQKMPTISRPINCRGRLVLPYPYLIIAKVIAAMIKGGQRRHVIRPRLAAIIACARINLLNTV